MAILTWVLRKLIFMSLRTLTSSQVLQLSKGQALSLFWIKGGLILLGSCIQRREPILGGELNIIIERKTLVKGLTTFWSILISLSTWKRLKSLEKLWEVITARFSSNLISHHQKKNYSRQQNNLRNQKIKKSTTLNNQKLLCQRGLLQKQMKKVMRKWMMENQLQF